MGGTHIGVVMLSLPTPRDLRSKRARLGLTQEELADQADVSQSLVARIELGEVDPSYSTLKSLVGVLNEVERREVTVDQVMNREVVSVGPEESVREVVDTMRARGFSQVPVLEDGLPVGSVTETSIVNALGKGRRGEIGDEPVRSVMAAPFPALDPDEPVEVAVRMLEDRAAVLVMEEGRVVGLVTKNDLLGTIEASGAP